MVQRGVQPGVQPGVRPGDSPAVSGPRGDAADDWTVQAADSVERLVGTVRDKTSVPLTTVARGVVFGLMVAIMGVVVAVLVAVSLVRVIDVVTGEGNVWIAHLAVGGIFSVVGGVLLRKATTTAR